MAKGTTPTDPPKNVRAYLPFLSAGSMLGARRLVPEGTGGQGRRRRRRGSRLSSRIPRRFGCLGPGDARPVREPHERTAEPRRRVAHPADVHAEEGGGSVVRPPGVACQGAGEGDAAVPHASRQGDIPYALAWPVQTERFEASYE